MSSFFGVQSQLMEDRGSEALHRQLDQDCHKMDIWQTRRGCWQEFFLGWDARTEFKYYANNRRQIAHSLEDSNCLCRIFCTAIHPFTMNVRELKTNANIVNLHRPLRCPMSGCKCCCYQVGHVTSDNHHLGTIRETCTCCVPEFLIFDHNGNGLYRLHQPTCCCGFCVDPCAEGNPCCWGRGWCKVPFHIFPYHQINTNAAPRIGKILKKPKNLLEELFTNAEAFEVDFPKDATPEQKGILVGAAILLNAVFFEGEKQEAEEVIE